MHAALSLIGLAFLDGAEAVVFVVLLPLLLDVAGGDDEDLGVDKTDAWSLASVDVSGSLTACQWQCLRCRMPDSPGRGSHAAGGME